MADTLVTSTLTPKANPDGKTVSVRQFKITDIPDAMRKMDWLVAAALMDHWFEGKPWDNETLGMPSDVKKNHLDVLPQYIETTIIKMGWALQFRPVDETLKFLLANWDSPRGREQMLRVFEKHYADVSSARVMLDFRGQVEAVQEFGYFNSRPYHYSKLSLEVDELRAALADFTLKVVAEGVLEITPEKYIFYPAWLGFYIDDTYDFIDDPYWPSQILGYWNFEGMATRLRDVVVNEVAFDFEAQSFSRQSILMHVDDLERKYADISARRYFLANNKAFQEYRVQKNRGGDFRIYSDMHIENISAPPIKLDRSNAQ